jgi:hypothetical protein
MPARSNRFADRARHGASTNGPRPALAANLRAGRPFRARRPMEAFMKYGILWLLGIPLPVILILYLMFHH